MPVGPTEAVESLVHNRISIVSRPCSRGVVVGPGDRGPLRFQWSRVEAKLKVGKYRVVVTPSAPSSARRCGEDCSPSRNARRSQDVVKQSKFGSRVSEFTAGEEALAKCCHRMAAQERVYQAQMPAPVSKLSSAGW